MNEGTRKSATPMNASTSPTPYLSTAAKYIVLALLVVLPVEVCSYFVAQILIDRRLLYEPDETSDFTEYLSIRDPLLGWPAPGSFGTGAFDSIGSRNVPSFPDTESPECVALFGDSFTFGDEVSDTEAWGNLLAETLDCRVANFGVPGYGTDQAYLRYRDRIDNQAPIVILGFWSENIVRNANRYRNYLTPNAETGFKPRFVAQSPDDELRLIRMPEITEQDFSTTAISEDWFAPGAGGGLRLASFPYSIAVLQSLGHFKIRAALDNEPSYAQFYSDNNESGAFETTASILSNFALTTSSRNQDGIVLLLPSDFDLEHLRIEGSSYYHRLSKFLRESGIEVLDTAPLFLADLNDRPACEIYIHCGGHLSPEGNAWLARYVADYLRNR